MREDVLISPIERVSLTWFDQPEQTRQWQALEHLTRQKEAEGWIGAYRLPVRASEQPNPPPSDLGPEDGASLAIHTNIFTQRTPHSGRMAELALRKVRQVRGEYCRVTLRLMHDLALRAQVPFDTIDPEDEASRLPEDLMPIVDCLLSQIAVGSEKPRLKMQQLDLVRQRYTHYSAHYNPIDFMALGAPASLRLPKLAAPNAPTQSGERVVLPNR